MAVVGGEMLRLFFLPRCAQRGGMVLRRLVLVRAYAAVNDESL